MNKPLTRESFNNNELISAMRTLITTHGLNDVIAASSIALNEMKTGGDYDKALEYRAIILEHTARDFRFLAQYE